MTALTIGLIAEAGARKGATDALIAVGKLPTTIKLSECKELYGSSTADELRLTPKIKWFPVGKGGATSGVYAKREDVEAYLFQKNIEDIVNKNQL